jgi:hypothetical protein
LDTVHVRFLRYSAFYTPLLLTLAGDALERHFEPGSLAFLRRVADPVTRAVGVKAVEVVAASEGLGARLQGALAAVAIGATVIVMGLVMGPITGASMNPARSIGPAVATGDFSAAIRSAAAAIAIYRRMVEAARSDETAHG